MLAVVAALLVAGCAAAPASPDADPAPVADPDPTTTAVPVPDYGRLPGVATNVDLDLTGDALARWATDTAAEPVTITSTVDGAPQRALWLPPPEPGGPLLLVAHSWSDDYSQELNIPLARWAEEVGWGYLQPDFRGRNDDPAATGSDLAVQDVVDAVDFAVAGGVDPDRVYVLGFSGGGMMALLLAGRHADRFAGAVAWVPIHDLEAWYAYRLTAPGGDYASEIRASCGGDPTVPGPARESCAARSPSGVLPAAAAAGVPVYLGAGLDDEVVPPSDAFRSFNALAAPADRIPEEAVLAAGRGELAPELQGRAEAPTGFTDSDPGVLFSRRSASVTLVVFDGGHELVYYPGVEWLARLDAARP